MTDSIPPIIRGEFVYRDVLLVDVGGELKRHPRAPESEIKALLNGKNAKDKVGHWWEAQLIHYGLQRSKQKDTAKVRLQQAISQGKLKAQPLHLADMESSMKKDYAAAVRKAKKPVVDSGKGTKRAREDEVQSSAKKTKIPIKARDISTDIEHSGDSTSKKQKATKATPAKPAGPRKIAKQQKSTKAQPVKDPATMAALKTPSFANENVFQRNPAPSRINSTARKSAPWTGPTREDWEDIAPRDHLENGFQRNPAPLRNKTTARKSAPWTGPTREDWEDIAPRDHLENVFQRSSSAPKTPASVKREPGIKRESGATSTVNRAAPVKQEGYLFDPDAMDTRPGIPQHHLKITGVYTLECPQITEQLPDQQDKLRLFICVDHESGVTWGGFELAMKSGTLKMDDVGFSRKLTFGWRARDSQEGNLRFGKGCFGDIEFDGYGNVQGTFQNLFNETMGFEGSRRPGPLWAGKSAYKFEQDWNAFPSEAYGR